MIRELINDIAFDKIKLSQAVTRAKIVESRIKNDNFKAWLKKELEGYDYDDVHLPQYRKIYAPIYLNAEFPFGRTHRFQVIMPDSEDKEIADSVYYHRITEPITIVETQVNNFENSRGFIKISQHQVNLLADLYKSSIRDKGGVVQSGSREVGMAQYQEIIELTKQKLLDTLIELESEFPNLINDYKMTDENNDKVQNIITNNIYGNNNPMNVAAGQTVKQCENTFNLSAKDIENLKELGVTPEEVQELETIITEESATKESIKPKAMKWLGSVSASVAAKGLYESIPAITDFIMNLI